jgi:hypothetical protein
VGAVIRILSCVPLLALLTDAQPPPAPKPPATLEVCELQGGKSTGVIRLRGIGRLLGEFFVLIDTTCPGQWREGESLERMVRVRPVRFARAKDGLWIDRAMDRFERPLMQLEVEGRASCVKKFTVTFDNKQRAMKGNGYGRSGLHQCEIQDATLLGLWYAGSSPVD